jgi:hypothetical protein
MSRSTCWNQSKKSGVGGDRGSACVLISCLQLFVNSLLMALLYDMTLKFPSQHSSKKLGLCGKQTRRPNARAPEDEGEEDAAQGTKLHWCPVTVCDDMAILPAPKAKVVKHSRFVSLPAIE